MSIKIEKPEDLNRLREQARGELEARSGPKETSITVHMGTCGIAAGARDIMAELTEQLAGAKVENVTLHQSGCLGLCDLEPMLTIRDKSGMDYLYVHLNREKIREIVADHVLEGKPVRKYILEE
jgi:NADP-reducing hydrogenase subunit HndB